MPRRPKPATTPKASALGFDQALYKMAALCSTAEHCESEVREKLRRMGLPEAEADRIIDRLYDERYIDTSRYCHAYVRDKFRFAHWGRVKIEQGLKLKRLPEADIRQALATELPPDDYRRLLLQTIQQKADSLPDEPNDYNRRAKLIRFAVGRGFALSEVLDVIGAD